jgi:hypothetical protein
MGEIYCLYSTGDGEPRYVGPAENGTHKRLKQHRTLALEMVEGALYDWIRDLYRRGWEVQAHVLQSNVIPGELEFFEKYWIAQFPGLLNVRDLAEPPAKLTDIGEKIIIGLKARLAAEGQAR